MSIVKRLAEVGLSTSRFFPLSPDFKPKIKWSDESQWTNTADGYCACVTGNGLMVIDLDRKGGRDGLAEFKKICDEKKINPRATLQVQTKSDGRHLYYRLPDGVIHRNTAGRITGVDTRGDGGYVNCPPSLGYRILVDRQIAMITPELLDLFGREIKTVQRTPIKSVGLEKDYALIIRNLIAQIAYASEGVRNDTLYKKGLAIAIHCRATGVEFPQEEVWDAACRSGLTDEEIEPTLKSIYDAADARSDCEPFVVPVAAPVSQTITTPDPSGKSMEENIQEFLDSNPPPASPLKVAPIEELVPVLIRASEIKPSKIQWLWPARFALGEMHLFSGQQGVGKSTIMSEIIARVTTGAGFDDCPEFVSIDGSVLMISLEDAPDKIIVPRLRAAGADMDRVIILKCLKKKDEEIQFNLTNMEQLKNAVEQIPDIKMVVIDPLGSVMSGTDTNRDTHVRETLHPVLKLSRDKNICTVLVGHIKKGKSTGSAQDQLMGSQGIPALCRCVHMVAENKEKTRVNIMCVKSNLSLKPPAMTAQLQEVFDNEYDTKTGRAIFMGTEEINADDIFSDPALAGNDKRDDAECREFILDTLAQNAKPMESDELQKACAKMDFKTRVYYRVSKRMAENGELIGSQSFGGKKKWGLPIDKYKSEKFICQDELKGGVE